MNTQSTTSPQRKRVLIAEDNGVLGDVIHFNLQRVGLDVVLTKNGHDAASLLSSSCFDVLVTDYEMPIIKGEELCRIAREDLNLQSLVIVMCSAKGLELNREQLKVRYNIADVLFKPFSVRDLTDLVLRNATVPPTVSLGIDPTSPAIH